MQHRVYKLNNRLTIFGLEMTDIGVAAVSFFLMNALVSATLDTRLNIVLIIAGAFIITSIWVRIKDNVPDKFFMHLIYWLAEKDQLHATPDLEPAPVIVDVEAAMTTKREHRRKKRR